MIKKSLARRASLMTYSWILSTVLVWAWPLFLWGTVRMGMLLGSHPPACWCVEWRSVDSACDHATVTCSTGLLVTAEARQLQDCDDPWRKASALSCFMKTPLCCQLCIICFSSVAVGIHHPKYYMQTALKTSPPGSCGIVDHTLRGQALKQA